MYTAIAILKDYAGIIKVKHQIISWMAFEVNLFFNVTSLLRGVLFQLLLSRNKLFIPVFRKKYYSTLYTGTRCTMLLYFLSCDQQIFKHYRKWTFYTRQSSDLKIKLQTFISVKTLLYCEQKRSLGFENRDFRLRAWSSSHWTQMLLALVPQLRHFFHSPQLTFFHSRFLTNATHM